MKTHWLVYYYYYYYYWLTNCAHLTVSLKSWLLYRFSPAWGDSGISPEWTPKISLNTKIAISWKAYVFCIKKCLLEDLKRGPLKQSLIWTLINSECEWCIRGTARRLHALPKDWVEMWGGIELDDPLASWVLPVLSAMNQILCFSHHPVLLPFCALVRSPGLLLSSIFASKVE